MIPFLGLVGIVEQLIDVAKRLRRLRIQSESKRTSYKRKVKSLPPKHFQGDFPEDDKEHKDA